MSNLKEGQRYTPDGLLEEVVTFDHPQRTFIVRELGYDDFAAYQRDMVDPEGKVRDELEIQPALVFRCVVNDNGERVYEEQDGRVSVGKLSRRVISKLHDACARVNGIASDGVEEAKKPSEATPS